MAEGVNPCSAKYTGFWNLLRWRAPLSQSIVTMVWPGPSKRATRTAPTQFIAEELPINSPSFLSKNLESR